MNPIFRTINFALGTILRSPLHRLLSRNLLLITVTGRQSQHPYTVPVSYQLHDNEVRIVSERRDHWWRNLRGGAPVTVQLQGQEVTGQARVIENAQDVQPLVTEQVEQSPAIARMLNLKRSDQGQFKPQDLLQAAERLVVVCVALA
jgi:deazaflavin-dependent oxidoreductase (nitroreductase family)